MARPAKSTRVKTGTITKKEEAVRAAVEDNLRGGSAELSPPDYLSDDQKKVFYFIVEKLAEQTYLAALTNTPFANLRLRHQGCAK